MSRDGDHRDRPEPYRFRLGNRPPLTGIRALALFTVLDLPLQLQDPARHLGGHPDVLRAERVPDHRHAGRRGHPERPDQPQARSTPGGRPPAPAAGADRRRCWPSTPPSSTWPTRRSGCGATAAAAMFYYADYRQAFGHAPFFGYLAQTWSLSMEEQFYIIWSVLMVAARRRPPPAPGLWLRHRRHRSQRRPTGSGSCTAPTTSTTRCSPASTTPSTPGPTPCSSAACSACWPPTATSTTGRRGPRGLLAVGAAASAVVLVLDPAVRPAVPREPGGVVAAHDTVASAVIIVYFVICPMSLGSRLVGHRRLRVHRRPLLHRLPRPLPRLPGPATRGRAPTGPTGPPNSLRLAIIFAIAIASWFLIERPLMRWRRRSAARDGSAS